MARDYFQKKNLNITDKILAFDFDGTLVDSKDALADAFNESFRKNNLLRVDKEKNK